MDLKLLVLKFFVSILALIGGIYLLASLSMNFNNMFGPVIFFLTYGPVYLFDSLGLPVLERQEMFGIINAFGWFALIMFYLAVAYLLAWLWKKFSQKYTYAR